MTTTPSPIKGKKKSREEIDNLKRQILFVPCQTKDKLHAWIKTFLDLDIPNVIVDPTSTSSPMDMIWEVYSKALANNDPTFNRVLYFACRDGFKCRVKGSLLLSKDRGLVPIEDVKVGETIWSGFSWQPVTDWIHEGEKASTKLELENGLVSVVSPVHRVWAWKPGEEPGWATASSLTPDDDVCVQDDVQAILESRVQNKWVKVRSSVTDGVLADFYDLTVANDHSYWSDGVINHNTLAAAVLEVLAIVHLGRDVAHMAAIEKQSKKSQQYVKKFFNKPVLRDYMVGTNQEIMWIVRYQDTETGKYLPEGEFLKLPKVQQDRYKEYRNYISIVICTEAGANSEHVPFFCVDEIDVVRDPKAYEEAKMIPAPINGLMPITMLISTRKKSFGLVQKEIDEQVDQDGNERLKVRHWNLIDVTEACPTSRHRPDLPKLPIYVNDSELRAIPQEKYDNLSPEAQAKFVKEEGYAGCITNCRLYPACRGRLATKQTSTSKLLKPIDHVVNMFTTNSVPYALAQLLCLKPSSEGLIYPNFDKATHMLTAQEMAEMVTGRPHRPNMSRNELIALFRHMGCRFVSGIDYGFVHNFVCVTSAVFGFKMFVFDVISQAELEPSGQIQVMNGLIKGLAPDIFPDPENPQMTLVLQKAGFRMRKWKKLPGSIVGGIDSVRMKLRPPMGEPQLFLLKGDPGCELLARRLGQYHWKTDAANRLTSIPDDTDDDECFSGDMEVLTKTGWRQLARMNMEHEVLAVTKDGVGKFEYPLKVIAKDYHGRANSIPVHPWVNFIATQGHRHAVVSSVGRDGKYRLEKKTFDEFSDETSWAINLNEWPSGRGVFRWNMDEAWLAGAFLSIGNFDGIRHGSIHLTEPPRRKKFQALMVRLSVAGWKVARRLDVVTDLDPILASNRKTIVVTPPEDVIERWRELFLAPHKGKKLSTDVVMAMSSRERAEMWSGYQVHLENGAKYKKTLGVDISDSIFDGIQLLGLTQGYAGRRSMILAKKVVPTYSSDFENVTFFGKVYCVNTSTGYFLARCGSRVFVAGNCDALRYLVMNTFKNNVAGIKVAKVLAPVEPGQVTGYTKENWMRKVLEEAGVDRPVGTASSGSKGSFKWSI